MKINQDYLKKLLEAFEDSPRPTVDVIYLRAVGLVQDENVFLFHMHILHDQGFIEREDKQAGFGRTQGAGDDGIWSVIPLRLTAHGHEFLEAIRNVEVWSKIKNEFRDASLGTLWKVSKELLESYTKKKIEALIN